MCIAQICIHIVLETKSLQEAVPGQWHRASGPENLILAEKGQLAILQIILGSDSLSALPQGSGRIIPP